MRWLRYTVVSLLITSSIILLLLFTHSGSLLVVSAINNFIPNVSLQLKQGRLITGAKLTDVRLTNDTLSLFVTSIDYKLTWSLLSNVLSVEKMIIDGLQISFHTDIKDIPKNPVDNKLEASFVYAVLPITIKMDASNINNITITQGSRQVTIDSLYVSTKLINNQLVITKFLAQGLASDRSRLYLSQAKSNNFLGAISLSGVLDFQSGIHWSGQLDMSEVDLNLWFPKTQGVISGSVLQSLVFKDQKWALSLPDINIYGKLMGKQFKLTGNKLTANSDQQWHVDDVTLTHGDNKITVNGIIDDQSQLAVSMQIIELSQTLPDFTGQITGTAKLAGSLLAPQLYFNLQGIGIDANNVFLQEVIIQGNLQLSAKLEGELNITANGLLYQQQMLADSLVLVFVGDAKQSQLSVKQQGPLISTDFLLTGIWQGADWLGGLQYANISLPEGLWSLQEVANIELKKKVVTVQPACWQSNDSQLCIAPSQLGSTGNIEIQLIGYQLSRLNLFLPDNYQLTGLLSGNGHINWQQGSKLDVHIQLNSIKTQVSLPERTAPIPIRSLAISGELSEANVALAANLDAEQFGKILLQANIDPYSRQKNINAQLSIEQLNLDAIKTTATNIVLTSGLLSAQLIIKGSIKQPKLYGSMQITNGLLSEYLLPVKLTDFNSQISFQGHKASVSTTFHGANDKGQLSGQISWQNGFQVQLALTGEQLTVDYLSQARLLVSPKLNLVLTQEKWALTGDVIVLSGQINIESLPSSAISVSKDEIIIDTPKTQQINILNTPVNMELNIKISDTVQLQSFGLIANLAGGMRIEKHPQQDELTASGVIQLVDGSYQAFGQDLLIQLGQIIFAGSIHKPYLSIQGIRNPDTIADDVEVGIQVKGIITDPKVTIYSIPALPQQETISYLLRGKRMDDTKDSNFNLALTSTLVNLGAGQSEGVIKRIGKIFGIKQFAIDTYGSGKKTQLAVSGYLMPGVELSYSTGLFQSISNLTLKYSILPSLYLEATTGLMQAIDLYYKFDYP